MICDECETVAHCTKHGCIPKHQALDKMAENARELGLDYEQYKDAIEVSVIFHKGQRMFAVPKQPAQQEMPDDWFKGMSEEYRREAWRIKEQPAQRKPWGFHIQFNNGKDATFKGLDYLAECEAHLEAGETITMLYIKENT